jgi:hypothetical protein
MMGFGAGRINSEIILVSSKYFRLINLLHVLGIDLSG